MKPDAKHLEMAINLIEQQTIDFNPDNYKDRYQEALVEMLSEKQPEIVKRLSKVSRRPKRSRSLLK